MPVISAVPEALSELATLAELHVCAAHVIALKLPLVPHVAVNVEVPAYPVSHVTVIVSPVSPLIAPVAALLELATSVAAQLLAVHVRVLKLPSVPHVAVGNPAPAPVYPGIHSTVTVVPVLPEMSPADALSELATLAEVHALMSQQSEVTHVSAAQLTPDNVDLIVKPALQSFCLKAVLLPSVSSHEFGQHSIVSERQ